MEPPAQRKPAEWAALALCFALLASCAGASDPRPSVLLVTLDTTRRDHLGLYGYARNTSPNLDALGRESAVHTRAYSTSSWTLPAHASLFTGKLVTTHGARYDPEGPLKLSQGIQDRNWQVRARGLSPGEATMASELAKAGYQTAGFVAGPWLKKVFGLDLGFQHYDDSGIEELDGRPARSVSDAAIAWLDQNDDRPFFLFLNYYDPHDPYRPPLAYERAFLPQGRVPDDKLVVNRALYDAEILVMDQEFGRVLDHLRERGVYDDMWIIVTADHGELFGEHGKSAHGRGVYEPEIRIPLVIKRPDGVAAGTVDEEPILLTDLLPTLFGELGVPVPAEVGTERRPLIAELHPKGDGYPGCRALIEGDYKVVAQGRRTRLFDLSSDPDEQHNLGRVDRERALAMRRRMDSYLASVSRGIASAAEPSRSIDAATRRTLQQLGYLE